MIAEKKSWAPAFFLCAGLSACAALAWRLWPCHGYYLLPAGQRPLDPFHEFLRPSGRGGLTFGILGTLLMVLNLGYLARKRLIEAAWLGSLRSWMAFHVFTGLLGSSLVVLHSAFLPRSALGILASLALFIVVVTGVLGRYIYAHTPRSIEGRELELGEIRQRLEEYRRTLEARGMPHEFFQTAASPAAEPDDRGLLATLAGLAAGDGQIRRDYRDLRRHIEGSPALKPLAREILPLAKRYCRERHWAARYGELRSLMGSWRFLHRWFAILMLIAAGFHIWVAVRLGHLWIFES